MKYFQNIFKHKSNSSERLHTDLTLFKLMLLLLLSHFSRVRLCATPSLGFSRQEHWSGLPFLSPMHKSEKWKWSRSAMSESSPSHGLQPTWLLHPWDFPGRSTRVECHCLLRLFYWYILIYLWVKWYLSLWFASK